MHYIYHVFYRKCACAYSLLYKASVLYKTQNDHILKGRPTANAIPVHPDTPRWLLWRSTVIAIRTTDGFSKNSEVFLIRLKLKQSSIPPLKSEQMQPALNLQQRYSEVLHRLTYIFCFCVLNIIKVHTVGGSEAERSRDICCASPTSQDQTTCHSQVFQHIGAVLLGLTGL